MVIFNSEFYWVSLYTSISYNRGLIILRITDEKEQKENNNFIYHGSTRIHGIF